MSAVLGILRGHEGAISVQSAHLVGSTFRVLFPAREMLERDFPNPGEQVTGKNWRGRGTVLLADDEVLVCDVGRKMLERLGFDVLTALDGREAVEVYRQHADEIVCVLLDKTMPHLDGEQAFRDLRSIRPDVRVVLCSGYNIQEDFQDFASKGLVDSVQKPFSLSTLRETLSNILGDMSKDPGGD